ncbi:MAG: UDP-3-O-[3-hydroxymyristoyl] N-acetylglucosamine deacetylase [Aquificota bacterium]|nr:MAG: UDP-3-O-[3-hydroxymyristoyl] N-acetylglucosamine deacetylase [Aquificota bacterium]
MEYPSGAQRTLEREIEIKGYGLHTGKPSTIRVRPAPVDTGIVFVREGVEIPAHYSHVVDVSRATNLGKNGVVVRTVEHLLSALAGLGIDNAVIEVEGGEEIPGMDGSSSVFTRRILEAGVKEQDKPRRCCRVVKPFRVEREDGSFMEVSPNGGGFKAHCAIKYEHPFLSYQATSFEHDPDGYVEGVAPARTYCFYEEIAHLLKQGLGRGGNIKNAVVIGKEGVLNGPPRFEDEPVRHKLLDLLGDLKLLGLPIMGELRAFKAGHAMHLRFLKAFAESGVFEVIEAPWRIGK